MGSRKIGKYIRLNASRSGISVSAGVKGMRVSLGTKGLRTHVTVPGTGYTRTKTLFSFRKMLKKSKKKDTTAKKDKNTAKVKALQLEVHRPELVEDELVLAMAKRRPYGSYTQKAKADRLVNKAIEAYNIKKYQAAVDRLREALTFKEDDMEAVLYLAVILYLHLEDYKKALEAFTVLPHEMLNEDMKLAIADCYHETGQVDQSLEILQSFKFEDDEDMERCTLLARNHMKKGNYELAEMVFKETVGRKRKMTPYLMDAKYWMGVMYLRVGDRENAKKHLTKVYLEDGDYENIAINMEELGLLEGDA